MLSGARAVKKRIGEEYKGELKPLKEESALRHPMAVAVRKGEIKFSEEEKKAIEDCNASVKLVITPENYEILLNFYESRKKIEDNLGKLYRTLKFEEFLLRLFHKRFKEVYLDGRAIFPRDDAEFKSAKSKKDLLYSIGSPGDKMYLDYLTLEEMVLSPLVLAQATSIVIGTGSRSEEESWDMAQELKDSVDIATFSYPAAAEFRDGNTVHYDYLFIAAPVGTGCFTREQIENIKKIGGNRPLLTAAREIYGDSFISDSSTRDELVILRSYLIHKGAYKRRTKNTLRQVLLAADQEMSDHKLGTTYQLKGLGLGAFSFRGGGDASNMEALYLEALYEVLKEEKDNLKYIKRINLINLPSTFGHGGKVEQSTEKFNGILVTKMNMDPTDKTTAEGIGGVVICGDSGSMVGNEANTGTQRSSSDDPAAVYSQLNPVILDPACNVQLQKPACIFVIQNGFIPLSEYKPELKSGEEKRESKGEEKKEIPKPSPKTFVFEPVPLVPLGKDALKRVYEGYQQDLLGCFSRWDETRRDTLFQLESAMDPKKEVNVRQVLEDAAKDITTTKYGRKKYGFTLFCWHFGKYEDSRLYQRIQAELEPVKKSSSKRPT